MTVKKKLDRRLLGSWKSDRRKTFRHFRPRRTSNPQRFAAYKALFGRLIVRWSRARVSTELDGHRTTAPYTVVAHDENSVVVRTYDELSGQDVLRQIHFEGEHYWIGLGGGLCEYFRRID